MAQISVPFNKPYLTGRETEYIHEAVASGKISGNGTYTRMCHKYFEGEYNFRKCLLTSSCTDALEMAAILCKIQEGDEVIMPSYTFVSTANAFILRGARIVFADSRKDHPGMDESSIEKLITNRTKCIVVVHYAGVSCDMSIVMGLAGKYNLLVIEDAAQAIDSYFVQDSEQRSLGSIGHLAAFSFHETKNIISGEGGMLVVNDEKLIDRAEIIWEKGTNRSSFFRGEAKKYEWIDIGSSFLPSEITAAFLYAQLEHLRQIQAKRIKLWKRYDDFFRALDAGIGLPVIPEFATNNAHMYYLILKSRDARDQFISFLRDRGILSVFHYQSLHLSPFYSQKYSGPDLHNADRYTNCLVRLPMFFELNQELVLQALQAFFTTKAGSHI